MTCATSEAPPPLKALRPRCFKADVLDGLQCKVERRISRRWFPPLARPDVPLSVVASRLDHVAMISDEPLHVTCVGAWKGFRLVLLDLLLLTQNALLI